MIGDGDRTFLFIAPHPLSSTFGLVTEDPAGLTVHDARSAQRENQPIRVRFLASDGQEREFWARSFEQIVA
jgi:hypothetical protein